MKTEKEKKSQKTIRSRPHSPKTGARARRKGHNYERSIVKFFRDLGFEHAKTSRLGSRLLDSAKVDICDIPFNVRPSGNIIPTDRYLKQRPITHIQNLKRPVVSKVILVSISKQFHTIFLLSVSNTVHFAILRHISKV